MDTKEIKIINDIEYAQILQQAVAEIQTARTTIARQVNNTVNSVYWSIGKLLFEKNLEGGYGSGAVNRLSIDLKAEFPDMGLSPRNLWYMKRYYELYYHADTKLQRSVAVLPWGHNILLIDKELPLEQILFYSQEAVQKGWKKDLLLNAIKMDTYASRQSQIKSDNFDIALPEAQADYANEVFRSSYNLGFFFDLSDILELLPKVLNCSPLSIQYFSDGICHISYKNICGFRSYNAMQSAYQMLLWCIDNNHIKTK